MIYSNLYRPEDRHEREKRNTIKDFVVIYIVNIANKVILHSAAPKNILIIGDLDSNDNNHLGTRTNNYRLTSFFICGGDCSRLLPIIVETIRNYRTINLI